MSKLLDEEIICKNAVDTSGFGHRIGRRLKGGEVLELVGDVGAGKTTFVGGMAKGAGSKDHVSSPTFVIQNVYKTSKINIHHFDFYRLEQAKLIGHELGNSLTDPKNVVAIEWGGIVADILPKKRVRINFSGEENSKKLELSVPYEWRYLLGRQ